MGHFPFPMLLAHFPSGIRAVRLFPAKHLMKVKLLLSISIQWTGFESSVQCLLSTCTLADRVTSEGTMEELGKIVPELWRSFSSYC